MKKGTTQSKSDYTYLKFGSSSWSILATVNIDNYRYHCGSLYIVSCRAMIWRML